MKLTRGLLAVLIGVLAIQPSFPVSASQPLESRRKWRKEPRQLAQKLEALYVGKQVVRAGAAGAATSTSDSGPSALVTVVASPSALSSSDSLVSRSLLDVVPGCVDTNSITYCGTALGFDDLTVQPASDATWPRYERPFPPGSTLQGGGTYRGLLFTGFGILDAASTQAAVLAADPGSATSPDAVHWSSFATSGKNALYVDKSFALVNPASSKYVVSVGVTTGMPTGWTFAASHLVLTALRDSDLVPPGSPAQPPLSFSTKVILEGWNAGQKVYEIPVSLAYGVASAVDLLAEIQSQVGSDPITAANVQIDRLDVSFTSSALVLDDFTVCGANLVPIPDPISSGVETAWCPSVPATTTSATTSSGPGTTDVPVTTTIPPIQTGTITVSGTLSVFVPCTDYAVSTNGRCGGAYGTKCPSGLCCSKYGYCQDDGGQDGAPWCDAGCQRGFGKCWANVTDPDNYNCPTATATYQLTTISSATPVYMACPSLPVSKDGRCGVDFGGTRCIEGYCCSVAGYCQDDGGNSGEPWCGGGCQIGMGKCFVGTAPLSSTFTCPGSTPSATISSSGSSTLTVRPTSDVANPSTTVYMTTTTQVPTSTSAFTLTTVSAKLPIYQPCTNLNVTSNVTNTCGINYGTRCPSGKCCSAAGLCQVTGNNGTDFCGTGCQVGYGKCWVLDNTVVPFKCPNFKIPSNSTGPNINLPVSPNGRCGKFNGYRCPNDICCSSQGWCQDDGGTNGAAWCGTGCQKGYGKCNGDKFGISPAGTITTVTATTTSSVPTSALGLPYVILTADKKYNITKDNTCGFQYGTRCKDNICCGNSGFCQDDGGTDGPAWCAPESCQASYGKCWAVSPPIAQNSSYVGAFGSRGVYFKVKSRTANRVCYNVAIPHVLATELENSRTFRSSSWEAWIALPSGLKFNNSTGKTAGISYGLVNVPTNVTASTLIPSNASVYLVAKPTKKGSTQGSIAPNTNATFAFCADISIPGATANSAIPTPIPLRARFESTTSPVYSTCNDNSRIAITFDDGPCNYTEALLDILKAKNAIATFFVVGSKNCEIGSYSDLITRMVQEGHQVGLHTWSHISIPYSPDSVLREEMGRIENAVYSAANVRPRYMRPPFGDWDDRSVATMGFQGYTVVTWDVTTDDWAFADSNGIFDVPTVLRHLDSQLNKANAGLISLLTGQYVLAHDVLYTTVFNLTEPMIDLVRDKGYTLTTVADCLGDPEPYKDDDPFAGMVGSKGLRKRGLWEQSFVPPVASIIDVEEAEFEDEVELPSVLTVAKNPVIETEFQHADEPIWASPLFAAGLALVVGFGAGLAVAVVAPRRISGSKEIQLPLPALSRDRSRTPSPANPSPMDLKEEMSPASQMLRRRTTTAEAMEGAWSLRTSGMDSVSE